MPTDKMKTNDPTPKKKIISKDFRTVVVSSIGGGANENLVHLIFGLEMPDPDTMQDVIVEGQAGHDTPNPKADAKSSHESARKPGVCNGRNSSRLDSHRAS